MKWLIDAQLPKKLADWLVGEGHDAIHTLDLPAGNRTGDKELAEVSADDQRILVTKDHDFVDSHLLKGKPPRLLLVTLGNSTNSTLKQTVEQELSNLDTAFQQADFVELGSTGIVLHDKP